VLDRCKQTERTSGTIVGDILQRSRAQRVESESLPSMDNGQLPSHSQYGALARGVGQLRRGTAHQRNHAGGVDDAALGLLVPAQTEHGMLGAVPDALHVDVVRQVPDLLRRVDGIRIVSVHDAGVVEDDISTAPAVLRLDHGLDVGFLGDVTPDGLDARSVGDQLLHFGQSFCQCSLGDVGHEDRGTFTGEKDGCLETDPSDIVRMPPMIQRAGTFSRGFELQKADSPCSTRDDSILALETSSWLCGHIATGLCAETGLNICWC
jgi:hypothetical protein